MYNSKYRGVTNVYWLGSEECRKDNWVLFIIYAISQFLYLLKGLPRCLRGKESTCQCMKCRFSHWVGRSPGEGNDKPLQYSCLGNPMDRGAWQATVHGVAKETDKT